MLLKDKVCIVTGASSLRGIGFATATLFAEHGAQIVAINLGLAETTAAKISAAMTERLGRAPELLAMACDIRKSQDCDAMVAAALDRYGRIDCLINCAGIVASESFLDITTEAFERMIDVNLLGAFNICQSVLPHLADQGSGSIVNISSLAAQRGGGLVGGAHYAATKGGMISMTRTIAREFGPRGVRANVVCPSMTETGMLDGNMTQEGFDAAVAAIPLRRAAKPVDIAGACLFLASDLAAYVTGATLDVNGGTNIR
jgi:NAD(P)-dependent dehydrogenase (short-subunit alcohol dehydrogenase family)